MGLDCGDDIFIYVAPVNWFEPRRVCVGACWEAYGVIRIHVEEFYMRQYSLSNPGSNNLYLFIIIMTCHKLIFLVCFFFVSLVRMEAVFAWCKGAKFVEVQKLTGTFEGTTIRTLRRLEELVRQLASAAKAIGNHELQSKFEKGSDLMKRDIVFCSSLYL